MTPDPFEAALRNDNRIMRLLQNDDFAATMNAFLRNECVCSFDKSRHWCGSFGEIGGLLAELRNRGENHLIFKMGGFSGNAANTWQEIELELARIGWRAATNEEIAMWPDCHGMLSRDYLRQLGITK